MANRPQNPGNILGAEYRVHTPQSDQSQSQDNALGREGLVGLLDVKSSELFRKVKESGTSNLTRGEKAGLGVIAGLIGTAVLAIGAYAGCTNLLQGNPYMDGRPKQEIEQKAPEDACQRGSERQFNINPRKW